MYKKKYRCVLISDFTINNLAGLLSSDDEAPLFETFTAPFNQVMSILLDENHECWKNEYDVAVVWTRPQGVIKLFDEVLHFMQVDVKELLYEVNNYCSALSNLNKKVRFSFAPSWTIPVYHRGFGLLETKPNVGITNILSQMNLRFFEKISELSNLYALDAQRWVALAGKNACNPKLWYLGKIAFGNEVFAEAAKDIKASIRGLTGEARKLIIVDLDDTLWGGIVGDDGWENLRLGGHDHIGEAYVDFQQVLKSFTNRGILLGIVSKNEERIALEAIEKHPEMILRLGDFAGWRINWNDKAQNILELVNELNIGLQSVIFLDDNPAERARVRESLPEVLVPELPQDKMGYGSAVLGLRCFDTPSLSHEDLFRKQLYKTERERKVSERLLGSAKDWLKSLDIKVRIESLKDSNLERTVQLLNKTNQMNLTTRRLTEKELVEWGEEENPKIWTFRVSDKFGDSGLTGIVSVEIIDNRARIVDFILSCRVMGRRIEEAMVYKVYEYAKSLRLSELYAQYIPTEKNKPCLDFWLRSGFEYDEKRNVFSWEMGKSYMPPGCVQIDLID